MPNSGLFRGLPALLVPKDVGFEMPVDKSFYTATFGAFLHEVFDSFVQ